MIVPIKDYPGYTITEYGNIFNANGVELKWFYKSSKERGVRPYPKVALYKNNKRKNFSVHRLVAIHFVPNPKNLKLVGHKDNNPKNPYYLNLEWTTNSENIQKAYDEGLISIDKKRSSSHKLGDNVNAKPVKIIHKQTRVELKFDSIRSLQLFLKLPSTCSIHQAIRESHRTVKGYYIERDV